MAHHVSVTHGLDELTPHVVGASHQPPTEGAGGHPQKGRHALEGRGGEVNGVRQGRIGMAYKGNDA